MNKFIFTSTLCSFFTLSLANSALAVPFKAEYSSQITFTSDNTATLVGIGQATFLGRTINNGNLTFLGPGLTCPDGFQVHNEDTLIAANGDRLIITISQNTCPTGGGLANAAGSWVVSGGTGRFADSTGSGTFVGQANFNTFTVDCTLTGQISSPGD